MGLSEQASFSFVDHPVRSWILTETRLHAAAVALHEPQDHIVRTFADGMYELLRLMRRGAGEPPPLRRAYEHERLTIIAAVIASSAEQLPLLYRAVYSGSGSPLSAPSLGAVLHFLDTARMCMRAERVMASVIDEAGDTLEHRQAAAELLKVIGPYEEELRSRSLVDYPLVLQEIGEKCSLARLRAPLRAVLPQKLHLERPSFLFPLEAETWRALSPLTRRSLRLDDYALGGAGAPSRRFAASVRELYSAMDPEAREAVPSANPEREVLIGALFDGAPSTPAAGIAVWDCESRHEEVKRVLQSIVGAKAGGAAGPFRLIVCGLDLYDRELRHEAALLGLPLVIPRGEAVRLSAPGKALSTLVAWLDSPTVERACDYFTSAIVRPPLVKEAQLARFWSQHISELRPLAEHKFLAPVTAAERAADFMPDFSALLRLAKRLHLEALPLLERQWLGPFVAGLVVHLDAAETEYQGRDVDADALRVEALATVAALAFLSEELAWREALLQESDPEAVTVAVRRKWFGERLTAHALRASEATPPNLLPELRRWVRASRAARRVFTELRAICRMGCESLGAEHLPPLQVLRMLSDALARAAEPEPLDGLTEDSVVVTELLDARGLSGAYCFLMGATPEGLRPSGLSSGLESTVADLGERLREQVAGYSRTFELYWLLGTILRQSRELVITFPAARDGAELSEAPIVTALRACQSSAPQLLRGPAAPEVRPASEPGRAETVIRERSGQAFGPFDGNLGPEAWSAVNTFRASGENVYSVSALEMLADCPHRFYFSRLLRLPDPDVTVLDELNGHVGTIVHACLAEFFSATRFSRELLCAANFAEAVQTMHEIALTKLRESHLDWNWNSLLFWAQQRVLAGLDNDGDDGRRGYLKAALIYCRELLKTVPRHVELKFGLAGGHPALRIEGERPHDVILIRGIIDRVDVEEKEASREDAPIAAVWDYKTSKRTITKADVDNARSLQIPLYAAFLEQQFAERVVALQGGIIDLARPERRIDEAAHGSKGVLLNILGGNPTAMIERATCKVRELDALVRSGRFNQVLGTRGCDYCEFRPICGRNVVLLEQRYAGENGAPSPGSLLEFRGVSPEPAPQSSTPRILSEEQKEALTLSRDVSLLAGAGSGKTFVLQSRIVGLLRAGNPLSSILAITFTEKAALEIRTRVEASLRLAVTTGEINGERLSDEEQGLLLEALSRLPEALIGTIHSFAARVLRMDPELAETSGRERVVEPGRQRTLALLAVRGALLGDLPGGRSAELEQLLANGLAFTAIRERIYSLVVNPRKLTVLQSSLLGGGNDLPAELADFVREVAARRREELRIYLAEWHAAAAQWLATDAPEILGAEELGRFAEVISRAEQILGLCSTGDPACELGALTQELFAYLTAHNGAAKRKSKRNPRNFWRDLREALKDFVKIGVGFNPQAELQAFQLARSVVNLAGEARRRYEQLKAEGGLLDFDDLVLGAHAMLCRPLPTQLLPRRRELIGRLRARLRHVLVDEFQDTDPEQWELISVLAERGSGESAANRSVFIVGDGKQAIYGFRGGDMRVFDAATEEICGRGGARLSLRDNYRSSPEVVEFVNAFFEKLFHADFLGAAPRAATAVQPQAMSAKRRVASEPGVSVLWTKAGGDDGEGSKECERIASFVRSVLEDQARGGSAWPLLREASRGPLIAVLTRTTTHLLEVAGALEMAGVPFAISHSSGFYQLEEILQLVHLLRTVHDRGDTLSLAGLLRSPLIGLDDRELLALARRLDWKWESLWLIRSGPDAALAERLCTWRRLAALVPASEFLSRVVKEVDLADSYEACGFPERYLNVRRFIERLEEAEFRGQIRPGATGILQWLSELERDNQGAPPANRWDDPVVLTTIHAAKGLEYPMVVLPFLNRKKPSAGSIALGSIELASGSARPFVALNFDDDDGARSPAILNTAARESAAALDRAEERRVFYVACTRAREYLVLSLEAPKNFAKNYPSVAELTDAQLQERVFCSDRPAEWLWSLCRVDDPGAPGSLLLEAPSGPITIPVIR